MCSNDGLRNRGSVDLHVLLWIPSAIMTMFCFANASPTLVNKEYASKVNIVTYSHSLQNNEFKHEQIRTLNQNLGNHFHISVHGKETWPGRVTGAMLRLSHRSDIGGRGTDGGGPVLCSCYAPNEWRIAKNTEQTSLQSGKIAHRFWYKLLKLMIDSQAPDCVLVFLTFLLCHGTMLKVVPNNNPKPNYKKHQITKHPTKIYQNHKSSYGIFFFHVFFFPSRWTPGKTHGLTNRTSRLTAGSSVAKETALDTVESWRNWKFYRKLL